MSHHTLQPFRIPLHSSLFTSLTTSQTVSVTFLPVTDFPFMYFIQSLFDVFSAINSSYSRLHPNYNTTTKTQPIVYYFPVAYLYIVFGLFKMWNMGGGGAWVRTFNVKNLTWLRARKAHPNSSLQSNQQNPKKSIRSRLASNQRGKENHKGITQDM